MAKRIKPPSIIMYQGANDKALFTRLKRDAKKFGVSISSLAVMCIEAGLGVIEQHFEELQSKSVLKK